MQNFVVYRLLGGVAEMHPNFIDGGADPSVNGDGFCPCWLNCSYVNLLFLR